jgi:hypothetical protein
MCCLLMCLFIARYICCVHSQREPRLHSYDICTALLVWLLHDIQQAK